MEKADLPRGELMAIKKMLNKRKNAKDKSLSKATAAATVGTGKRRETPSERGPMGWFLPVLESAYTGLRPRYAEGERSHKTASAPQGSTFRSILQPGLGEEVFAPQIKTIG